MITQRSMDRAKLRAKRKLARIKENTEYRFLGRRLVLLMQQSGIPLPEAPRPPELVERPQREDLEADIARLPGAEVSIPDEL